MRPRGLRNSVRIESLERRIAKTETRLGITPERPPPQPRTDLQASDLDVRIDALAARMAKLDDLSARMAKIDERLATVLAAQLQLQQELAELRKAAPPAPTPAATPPLP